MRPAEFSLTFFSAEEVSSLICEDSHNKRVQMHWKFVRETVLSLVKEVVYAIQSSDGLLLTCKLFSKPFFISFNPSG